MGELLGAISPGLGGSGRQTSFCPNSDYIAMSETLFGPKQLHSWAAALFARPEASLAHKGLCLFINVNPVQKQAGCRSWSFTSPTKLTSLMDMIFWAKNCNRDSCEDKKMMVMVGWWWSSPLPIVNQSLDQKLLQPFSLSPTLFWWKQMIPHQTSSYWLGNGERVKKDDGRCCWINQESGRASQVMIRLHPKKYI